MCEASVGAMSARVPVRMLTTPPGTSLVAIASASSIAASGRVSDATATTALPPTSGGMQPRHEAEQRRLVGCEHRDDAGRLGHGEVEVRARRPGSSRRAPAGACRPSPRTRRCDRSTARPRRGRCRAPRTRPRAPRPSRRRGRAPGRGCTRSPSPSPAAPCARPAPRRARPCASRARRSGLPPHTCGRTRCAGTRRR